ncbi:MAG: efflux RND transporter periplasmic adaptor subunit [Planctomycetales bacterium]|jgi:putative peptide zinc metalloprotease protein
MIATQKRHDLIFSHHADGKVIVKDPTDGEIFSLGEQEAFLLDSLDGTQTFDDVCRNFESRFGEPLSTAEVDSFTRMATAQGLLENSVASQTPSEVSCSETQTSTTARPAPLPVPATQQTGDSDNAIKSSKSLGNLLYLRRRLFNPNRLVSLLTPCVAFIWTRSFVACSFAATSVAMLVFLVEGPQIFAAMYEQLRWHSVVPLWSLLIGVIAVHEMAHALTCRRFGGEVRECGLLVMLMIPCVYVDVSDAWLFPKRSQRVWVSLAGGFCELLLWSAAVLTWRLTAPGSAVNVLALLLFSVTGFRSLFNFNPLIKLDGYYVLSDLMGIPNLFTKSREYFFAHCRWLLWGAPKPERVPRSKFVLSYAIVSWLFTTLIISFLIYSFAVYFSGYCGLWGAAAAVGGGSLLLRGLFRGTLGDDFGKMLAHRPVRVAAWAAVSISATIFATTAPLADRIGGDVTLFPSQKFEVRSSVAGFLETSFAEEGDLLADGDSICRLSFPDLEHRLATKRAALAEQRALIQKLEAGTRVEKLAEQQSTVDRAETEFANAEDDLKVSATAVAARLASFAARLSDQNSQLISAERAQTRAADLLAENALTESEYDAVVQKTDSLRRQIDQINAEQSEARLIGTIKEAAIVRDRQRLLDEAKSELRLLKLPSHPADLAAAKAGIQRLTAELSELESQQQNLLIKSPGKGTITTPRFGRTTGGWFDTGELICEIESTETLLTEIMIPEVHSRDLKVGQKVSLKLNGLPGGKIEATVASIGARIDANDYRSHQVARCVIENRQLKLHPGMTGTASIETGSQPLLQIILDRARKLLRSEFWF